jgi:hypothetical protein
MSEYTFQYATIRRTMYEKIPKSEIWIMPNAVYISNPENTRNSINIC